MPKGAHPTRASGANRGAGSALARPDFPNLLENLKLGFKTVPDETPRPNKHTDRVAWNNHVERELSQKYDSFSYSTKPLEECPDMDSWKNKAVNLQELNQEIAFRIKAIMRAEGGLIRLALDDLVYGTFKEADWAAMDVMRKEGLALEGLYCAACVAPRLGHDSRLSCPEMTVGHLAGDGEYNFVRMLKRLIDHDPTGNARVKSVFFFPHPYFEHDNRCTDAAPDFIKAALYWNSLLRNFYIVNTLLGILYAYHDRPGPPIHLPKATLLLRTEERKQDRKTFFSEFKKSGFNLEPQGKDEPAITLYACYTCSLETKNHTDLKTCGRCHLVRYCSSECQKNDWPSHKKFCSQERFDPALLTPTPEADDSFIGCPTTVEGFRRTPALWRQIRSLSQNDSLLQDYHFYEASGGTLSLRILDPPGAQMVFLVARRRAMASGSPPAVHMMFTVVKHQWKYVAGTPDMTLEQIRSQFEKEYRVKVTEMGVEGAGAFVPPTQQELEEERRYLEQRLSMADPAVREDYRRL
ncbi:hypothetical protein GGX14DRAFT_637636 [Mycena pura]|uniref:MYND-type domain-containing protein n=1 Tax=Mycena pura TaxID=153505 RepID=A0AAD6VDD0_9AGAR|nr:hypothetical protein GGX14DRAFT_637636 [Mycena pura]